jgi:anaerobic selenocysteine-containing dehydrogenase
VGLAEGKLRLMTMRSHDQYNTTIYGEDDRYRGVFGERRVVFFVHPDDLAERGIEAGSRVDITSEWRGEERVVRGFLAVPYELPRVCAGAYFPEANPLVPLGSRAEGSRTPASSRWWSGCRRRLISRLINSAEGDPLVISISYEKSRL